MGRPRPCLTLDEREAREMLGVQYPRNLRTVAAAIYTASRGRLLLSRTLPMLSPSLSHSSLSVNKRDSTTVQLPQPSKDSVVASLLRCDIVVVGRLWFLFRCLFFGAFGSRFCCEQPEYSLS
jgi:hypothetical protein